MHHDAGQFQLVQKIWKPNCVPYGTPIVSTSNTMVSFLKVAKLRYSWACQYLSQALHAFSENELGLTFATWFVIALNKLLSICTSTASSLIIM